MHIPLDYYRILGLPIQATPDQLRQAHQDRVQQMPRREYSDIAVESRKRLLDEAYDLLANPDRRRAYDASFLNRAYDGESAGGGVGTLVVDPHTPTIEIRDDQFVGALLLLQDLGEYELVLKLGRPFLKGGTATMNQGQFGDPKLVMPDIVLTVALACLELGREQWQQGQYENASEALETGQQLLLREGVFPSVRSEIQADLYKLRPYRILELVALPDEQLEERERGIHLLSEMLQDRGGIDGHEDDQSGLQIDDFLRFIQQLRGYMTAAEQQSLFEQEAQRPSAVGTYLAVYALLAKGFGDRQPALVRRAKQLLSRLSGRQDVHLEQAVCALLLGQTEEANRVLELSQEYEAIAFIREHSQGAPDLLPGLCLYTERWLQDEVMPHFRDLSRRRVALKDYFADQHVQNYLEALPAQADAVESGESKYPAVSSNVLPGVTGMAMTSTALTSDRFARVIGKSGPANGQYGSLAIAQNGAQVGGSATDARGSSNGQVVNNPRDLTHAAEAQGVPSKPAESGNGRGAGAIAGGAMVGGAIAGGAMALANRQRGGRNESASDLGANSNTGIHSADINAEANPELNRDASGREAGRTRSRRTAVARTAARGEGDRAAGFQFLGFPLQGLWGLGIGLLGLLVFCYVFSQLLRACQIGGQPKVETTKVQPQPVPSAVAPTPVASPTAVTGEMNPTAAKALIGLWLSAKGAAMGPNHDTSKLDQALAPDKKTEWEQFATEAKQEDWYKEYSHDVKVNAVEPSPDNPDSVSVLADVTEVEKYHQSGQLANTLDKVHNLRYVFVRENGQWRIQSWSDR